MRRLILILCSVMLTQASLGNTFVQDVPYSGPAVTSQILGHAESDAVAGQVATMLRVTYEPGGEMVGHAISASTMYFISSGTLETEVLWGEVQVIRAITGDAWEAQTEMVSVGQHVTLNAGDAVYFSGGAVETERNVGDVPTVVSVTTNAGGGTYVLEGTTPLTPH